MKKTLLMVSALWVTILAMAGGVLYAAEGESGSVVFDFSTQDYDMTRYTTGNDYNKADQVLADVDGIVLTNIKGDGNGTRLWSDGLRFYKTGKIKISSETHNITGVSFTVKDANDQSANNFEVTNEGNDWYLSYTPTSNNNTVVTLTVSYGEGGGSVTPGPIEPDQPENPGGEDQDGRKLTITTENTKAASGSTSYVSDPTEVTAGDNNVFIFDEFNPSNGQMRMNNINLAGFNLSNKTPLTDFSKVVITTDANNGLGVWNMMVSKEGPLTGPATTGDIAAVVEGNTITFTVPEGEDANYFFLNLTTRGSGTVKFTSIDIYCAEGTVTPGPVEPDPDEPGDDDGNVTQEFTTGLGFADASANVPKEEAQFTATDTGITYDIMGCYANNGYIMINGKNYPNAYISWTLDFPMSALVMKTSGGCSTNAASKVNVYANDEVIKEGLAVNSLNTDYIIEIPEAYRQAGTVYKVESATTDYNQQFASFTYVKEGNDVVIPEPDTPTAPEGVITVAKALDLIKGGYTGPAQVKGYISEIQEVSVSFGNATYFIVDELNAGKEALEIYRGYSLNGARFEAEDEIAVGALVTVEGELVNYNGTYEFTNGSKIIDYQAPQGGDVPGPNEPEGEKVTINFTDPADLGLDIPSDDPVYTAGGEYVLSGQTVTSGEVWVNISEMGDATNTNPRLYNSSGNIDLRFYKGQHFKVGVNSEEYHITSIEFTKAGGNFDMTPNVGMLNGSGSKTTWTPEDDTKAYSEVVFNITGTTRISTITVYYAEGSGVQTGVETIVVEEGDAVYYNLQGQRVNNPERGIYIKVTGNKAVKVVK